MNMLLFVYIYSRRIITLMYMLKKNNNKKRCGGGVGGGCDSDRLYRSLFHWPANSSRCQRGSEGDRAVS